MFALMLIFLLAIDSPSVRNGYTGLMLDLDEDDTMEKESIAAANAIQPVEERPTWVVSGEFFHSSSALYCLKHLTSLATTRILVTMFH